MKFWIKVLLIISIIAFIGNNVSTAQPLYTERLYEPVVLVGDKVYPFIGIPINQIFVYSYNAGTGQWQMIPFQIDERVRLDDPYYDARGPRHFYAIKNTNSRYAFADTLPVFDRDDELVFMVRDMGDKAPDNSWITNADALTHMRLEIQIYDPKDANKTAYAYLYQSSTLTMPDEVRNRYAMSFNPSNHVINTRYYSVGLSKDTGLVVDVSIKPPFGNGAEFFDTQKIRFAGLIDFGNFPIIIGREDIPAAREADQLFVYPNTSADPKFNPDNDPDHGYLSYTEKPIVRVVREVRQTLRFGDVIIPSLGFYVKTKFYPFSGQIEGGSSLIPDSLRGNLDPYEDYVIEFDVLRQSWDFNANAAGMKFINKFNDGVMIDGNVDNANKKIDIPIKEWTMSTGAQGTMFTHVTFKDTLWRKIELYFYDSKNGGQGDSQYVIGEDSGDKVSYGDQGILFLNLEQDTVSLELGFTAYFVEANKDKAFAQKLAAWVESPVQSKVRRVTDVKDKVTEQPEEFALYQNYPNPFNSLTKIRFSSPQNQHVVITIRDLNGRFVATVADRSFAAGYHEIAWNGRDAANQEVASGVYFYEIRTPDFADQRKLLLLR